MALEVGDIVHIKPEHELRSLSERMGPAVRIPYAGRVARIVDVDKGHPYGTAYLICANHQHWFWFDAMFEEGTKW